MYRVFDPEEKGIDAQKLSVMMNKLVTLVDKNIPDYYLKESNQKLEVPFVSIEDAQELINDSDIDGDGLLNLDEFVKLMVLIKDEQSD